MKLYQDPRAPNPRRVRIFFAEKGRSSELELIDLSIAAGELERPEHRARHPLLQVPVLELDDGRLLRESVAICRYLEELVPDPPLFGSGAFGRAAVEMWNRHAEFELLLPALDAFRHTHEFWKGRIAQIPEVGEGAKSRVLSRFAWLNDELGERQFIAGEDYSIADITALAAIDYARISQLRVGPELVHLRRWLEEVRARPSASA